MVCDRRHVLPGVGVCENRLSERGRRGGTDVVGNDDSRHKSFDAEPMSEAFHDLAHVLCICDWTTETRWLISNRVIRELESRIAPSSVDSHCPFDVFVRVAFVHERL